MDLNPKPPGQVEKGHSLHPGRASQPLLCHCTENIPGTNLTVVLTFLKCYAPDVFRIIAVPSEAVSALAQGTSPRSPPSPVVAWGWGDLCKGKRSQMTLQSYLANPLCYSEYPRVRRSLELCRQRRKRGHLKCFVILPSLGAKIAISSSREN